MYKIYRIIIFILIGENYVLCMESKDTETKPLPELTLETYASVSAKLEELWQSQCEQNRIIDEFLEDELIGIMKSTVQFIHSVNDLTAERKREPGKDSAYLGKKILSANLFYNIGDMIEKILALYVSLSELENDSPIIAKTLQIRSSFSSSFRQKVENIIRKERACLPFGAARIKLINSMKRLQYLTEDISKKISSVKDSEHHLKILDLLKSVAVIFQKEISLRKPIVRSKLRSGETCKFYKRGKIQKSISNRSPA
ncbi:MAG: hypothetical protein WCS92_00650 [Candidatus Babeliales bacterium]|jgi:hypothetical protein|nr:MAG: hypothetical protein US22_C0013G0012 [candidate division TM6 bacterium GW2011_GWF2_36_6]